ncbi:MAG TPA: hypothetical protein VF292_14055 [Rhodanobacteraceae bacterium]
MSKGPGRWQRAILAKLAETPAFYVRDLLPERPTVSQRSSLERASVRLWRAGRIDLLTIPEQTYREFGHNAKVGGRVIAAARLGTAMDVAEDCVRPEWREQARKDQERLVAMGITTSDGRLTRRAEIEARSAGMGVPDSMRAET